MRTAQSHVHDHMKNAATRSDTDQWFRLMQQEKEDNCSLSKFYPSSEPQTLPYLYQSVIRPHLQYACSVRVWPWDPHLKTDYKGRKLRPLN